MAGPIKPTDASRLDVMTLVLRLGLESSDLDRYTGLAALDESGAEELR